MRWWMERNQEIVEVEQYLIYPQERNDIGFFAFEHNKLSYLTSANGTQ